MNAWIASRRKFLTTGVLLSASAQLRAGPARHQSAEAAVRGAKDIVHSNNLDVVLAFCQAGQNRDLEAQMRFITDDSVYHNMPDEPCVGIAQIRAMLGAFVARADGIQVIVRNAAETSSGVVLMERLDRSHIKGKWIEAPVMGATSIVNGKVRWWRDYYDNQRLRSQIT